MECKFEPCGACSASFYCQSNEAEEQRCERCGDGLCVLEPDEGKLAVCACCDF